MPKALGVSVEALLEDNTNVSKYQFPEYKTIAHWNIVTQYVTDDSVESICHINLCIDWNLILAVIWA